MRYRTTSLLFVVSLFVLGGISLHAEDSVSVSEGESYLNETPGHTVCSNTTPPTLRIPEPDGCDQQYTCCYDPAGVGRSPEGQYVCPSSVIENVTFRYVSDVLDYAADATPDGGCVPCGSDATAIPGLPSVPYRLPGLQIRHILRPGNTQPSSFGPGVFSNFDISLNMFHELPNRGDVIFLMLPQSGAAGEIQFDRVGDTFYAALPKRVMRELRLYDAGGVQVGNYDDATTAIVWRNDGVSYHFDIFNGSKGRLARIVDRNGHAISVSYEYTTTSSASIAQKRKMTQVQDAYGRVALMNYQAQTVGGAYAIQQITLPQGQVLTYSYNDPAFTGLARIDYPDGTASTFTKIANPSSQCTIYRIFDAREVATHRRKDIYLTTPTWTDPSSAIVYPRSANRVRMVVNGDEEVVYLNWQDVSPTSSVDLTSYIYQGGGFLSRFRTYHGKAKSSDRAVTWTLGDNVNSFQWESRFTYQTDSVGRLTKITDGLNRVTDLLIDDTTSQVGTETYPDLSYDVTTWNTDQFPLDAKDRIGRHTISTYDAASNLLTRTRGALTTAAGTWTWTYANGLPQTQQDADLNITNYGYNAAGYLTTITEPADELNGQRAVWTLGYDGQGRLVTLTDPDLRDVTFVYDDLNRLLSRTYADGSTEIITYGSGANANLITERRDRNGNLTTIDYDASGRPIETVYGSGSSVEVREACSYVHGTDLKATCTRAGETTKYMYDYAMRLIATTVQPKVGIMLTTNCVFDVQGRSVESTDAFGRKSFIVYDVNDRPIRNLIELVPSGYVGATTQAGLQAAVRPSEVNPAYVITDNVYDAEGQVLARIDGRGIRSTFTYDSQGRLVEHVAADAWVDSAGVATLLAPPEAARTVTSYDDQGNVIAIDLPRSFARSVPGGVWSAGPDGSFRTTMTYTGRNLRKTIVEADGLDGVGEVRAERAMMSFTYSETGKLKTKTDPRLNTTTNEYGICCDRLVKITDPSGAETIFGYDYYGNRTSVIDPNGNITLTYFDARHRVSSTVNGEDEATTYAYDDDLTDSIGLDAIYSAAVVGLDFGTGSDGSAVAITNPANETTLTIYDGLGRTVRSVDPLNHATTTVFDAMVSGLVETTQSDPLNHLTVARTDGAGLTRIIIDTLGHMSTAAFDGNGNRVQSRDANGIGLDCAFDARNRDTTCTDTAGSITSKVFDAHDNVVTQTDALLNDTVCTYDARDRKVTCTDRISATTAFTYDLASNLLTITDAQSGVTEYAYDNRNLLIGELFPIGQAGRTQRAYAYDAGRRLIEREVSTIPASGFVETTEYAYDDANRLLTRSYDDSLNDTFTYDPASRLLTAVSARYGSTVTRAYDAASRLTSEALDLANGALSGTTVSAATYTVGYDYDADNRLTDITYPTGSVVERSYTDRNQLDTVKLNAVQIADRAYDNAGRLTSTVLGNGLTESRGYIANDNLIATIAVPGVTSFTYTYDANKRKLSETDGITAANTQTFSYDDQDRLTAWDRPSAPGGDTQSWNLSAVGDWTSTTRNSVVENRTHTAVHELTGINSNPLTYDAKGNLSGDDRNVSYAWDPENRLSSAIIPSSASPTFFAANAKYQYDALGRRIAKTVNGQTTVYLCGGAQVLVEIDRKAIPSQAQLNGSESDGTVANASLPVASGGVLPGTGVVRINFQPATATIPAGYYADKGNLYGVRTNGMSYGWALTATSDVVARNGAVPVPELDTLALMDPTSSGTTPPANVWEVALPNGSYPVIVVAGDPLHRNQTNDLQIENQSVTDLDPSSAQTYEQGDYDGYAVIATVADGKLTISQSSTGINAKLCFVEIGPEGTTIDSATLTRLADLIQQATNQTAITPGPTASTREYVYGGYVDELIAYDRTLNGITNRYFVHSNHLYSPAAITAGDAGIASYQQCAVEGQSLVLSMPSDVAYGANGHYAFQYGVSGSVVFNNATFGDPVVGTLKLGFCRKANTDGEVVERFTYNAYGQRSVQSPSGALRYFSAAGFDRGFTGFIFDNEVGSYYARSRMYSANLGRFASRDNYKSAPMESDRQFWLQLKILPGGMKYCDHQYWEKISNQSGMPRARDGYQDGMSLYFPFFVPGQLDPSGENPFALMLCMASPPCAATVIVAAVLVGAVVIMTADSDALGRAAQEVTENCKRIIRRFPMPKERRNCNFSGVGACIPMPCVLDIGHFGGAFGAADGGICSLTFEHTCSCLPMGVGDAGLD